MSAQQSRIINGVDVVFTEADTGSIEVSFEGGTQDADRFVDQLTAGLAEFKSILADAKRREQLKRDRTARFEKLEKRKRCFDAHEAEPENNPVCEWSDADQAELDHLSELNKNGEL